jgi:hypothetical protein
MKNPLSLAVIALSLSACASLIPPTAEQTAALPTVRYGQAAPEGKDHILLYPAGVALPMDMSISGNVFEKDEQATLNPRLKKDIYVYKHWVSLDGRNWVKGNELVSGNIAFHLPGEKDGRSPGSLGASFNLK